MPEQQDGPEPTMSGDRVRLVLPADPAYGRIARIAVSSLALRLGLSYAAVEDLRLALDETVILLLRPDGDEGDLTVEFRVAPHTLTIDATTSGAAREDDPAARRRFEEIVAGTVDTHEVTSDGNAVRLVKAY